MSQPKPFRCRIGWHSWYRDCALIRSVERCNDCDAVGSKKDAEAVAAERKRLDGLPGKPSMGDLYRAALDTATP